MIRELKTKIYYRCTFCGKIHSKEISIFDFSGNRTLYIECDCERFYFKLKRNKKGDFVFSYPCILCNEMHLFEINKKVLMNGTDVVFACPVFECEIFYAGDNDRKKQNTKLIKEQSEIILEAMGYNRFAGVNPYAEKLLGRLDFWKEKGRLDCKCSSRDIKAVVFYDRIELECSHCHTSTVIDASGNEDIDYITSMDSLILGVND